MHFFLALLLLPHNTTSLALSVPSQEVFTLYIYRPLPLCQSVAPRCAFAFFSTFAVNVLFFHISFLSTQQHPSSCKTF